MKKLLLGIMISAITLSSVCFAQLQSRPDRARLVSVTANDFFIMARKMESTGGVLAKTATINDTTGYESTSSNNIDAHMVKNTEYGAVAILSVSQYGNQLYVPLQSGKWTSNSNYTLGDSTTGDSGTPSYYYGLFDMANTTTGGGKYTYTATMHTNTTTSGQYYANHSVLYNAAHTDNLKKYVDYYSPSTPYKGDATTETKFWRGATNASFTVATYPVFIRCGGFFGCSNGVGGAYSHVSSRAVVVCGSGL